ncbi:hypothetical protein [Lentzea sp. NPDC003310]|uniref:hypothetical protein n=1 Tax=Lentzea sp. NPDC003310 TaxID=3154447 RepID=UPI0033BF13DB
MGDRAFGYSAPAAGGSETQVTTSRTLHRGRSVVDGKLVLEISGSTTESPRLDPPTKVEFWADDPGAVVRALRK